MSDTDAELAELQHKLESLEALRGVLGSEAFEQARADLEAQILAVQTGGGAVVTGPVHTNGGHFAGRDQYNISINPPAIDKSCTPMDDATALACYLDHVIAANRSLQLQGIRSAGQVISIDLEEVYVTLTATMRRTIKEEEALVESLGQLAPGEARRLERTRPQELGQQVKVQVQEALADSPRLVVLGDPGSGKTTLLRYLALTYARDLQGVTGLVAQRLQLQEQRLPILLPLRDFARYLEVKCPNDGADGPKLLFDYLRTYFANQDLTLPEHFFADRLKAGTCAVFLDGMDEVADFATRQRIARLIERFTAAYPENRVVVTSRIVGYTGAARLGAEYQVTTVRDFTDEDIRRFVSYWNRAVEVTLAGGASDYVLKQAEKKSAVLLETIQSNERVRELAVNPLLLTVIALVQRYRAQLPERRTELYEEAVEVLLGTWDQAKQLGDTAQLQGVDLDAGDRRSLLEPLALWMMERHAREIEADELRQQLERRFSEMLGDDRRAQKAVIGFLRLINERSGLIGERGQGIYAFSHLTFQEYLAARAVADRKDYLAYTLGRLGDSWWREVILLEAGYLSTQGKQRATELIRALMECMQESEPYHNLTLAAEALRDVGPARTEGDLFGEVQRRLRAVFDEPLLRSGGQSREEVQEIIRRRAAAAEALARVEGGRSGMQPAFWTLPYGEPVWVEVPAGEFWMGSERGESHEKPVHRLYLEAFKIAKVPITNAQYRLFVEAAGYKSPGLWENGRVPRGLENHPVVNVNWDDALAYCQWLSEVTGKAITLPTEAQWEKAARGDQDQREYPWGERWDAAKCNSRELSLGGTTPVGIFPEGASPYGCLDMVGNVWEWTQSLFKPYKYDPLDGREDPKAGGARVLRGGSFFDNQGFARCAYRNGYDPFFHNNGFRVVSLSASAL